MRKTMKICIRLAVILIVGASLAACSNLGKKSTSKSNQDATTTLRFWWWGNDDRNQATLKMIKNFEAENPTIKVKGEYVGFGSLEEKVTTMLAGGEQTTPDIIQLDRNQVARFSTDGKGFYDLNKIKSLDLSGYDKDFLKLGEFAGVQNGIPLGKNVVAVLFNKTAFEKNGVAIPKTWDDLKEAAKKFPEGSFPLAVPQPHLATGIYLQQKTGKTEFDDKGNMNYSKADYKEAIAWYMDMVKAGAFNSRKDYLENVGSEPASLANTTKFIKGEYAGVLEWTGGVMANEQSLKETGQELLVGDMLKNPDAKGTYSIAKATFLFSISQFEKNPEAAGEFLNDFLNGSKANEILGVSRGVPASKKAAEVLVDKDAIQGAVKEAYDYSQNVDVLNETIFFEDSAIQSILGDVLESIELKGMSVDEGADTLYNGIKGKLEHLKKTYNLDK